MVWKAGCSTHGREIKLEQSTLVVVGVRTSSCCVSLSGELCELMNCGLAQSMVSSVVDVEVMNTEDTIALW